ncbi:MAG: hypothetical protein ACI923_002260, partial [Flavobacteriales bacterium]
PADIHNLSDKSAGSLNSVADIPITSGLFFTGIHPH